MTEKKQELKQIEQTSLGGVQKIDLGWKGYVPGYTQRWVKHTNDQINQTAERINESTGRLAILPGGPIERPTGFKELSSPTETAVAGQQAAVQEETEFLGVSDQMADFALNQEFNQVEQQVGELDDRISYFKHPSRFKYLLLLVPLALLIDGLDILGGFMATTVVGVSITILLLFISIGLSFLMAFLFWFTDSKIKEARGYPKTASLIAADNVARIKEIKILNQSRLALRAAKTARNLEEIAKAEKAIRMAKTTARTARTARLVKFVTSSPITRIGAGAFLNAIPGLNLVPFMFIAILLSYWSEKKIYQNACESAEQAKQEILLSMAEVV